MKVHRLAVALLIVAALSARGETKVRVSVGNVEDRASVRSVKDAHRWLRASEQLRSVLDASGSFTVVENERRAISSEVGSGADPDWARLERAISIAEVPPPELLFMGTITEWDDGLDERGQPKHGATAFGAVGEAASGFLPIPFGREAAGLAGKAIDGAVAAAAASANVKRVVLELRVVDAVSSRLVAAATVEGTATVASGGAGVAAGPVAAVMGGEISGPMDEALRKALEAGVAEIARQLAAPAGSTEPVSPAPETRP